VEEEDGVCGKGQPTEMVPVALTTNISHAKPRQLESALSSLSAFSPASAAIAQYDNQSTSHKTIFRHVSNDTPFMAG
jgi:hypothetical protein